MLKPLPLLLFCAALLLSEEPPRADHPSVPCKVFPGSGQRPDLNCATIEKDEPNAAEIARAETAARTSQLALANATIQMQRIQADPVYREALAALEAANKATQAALTNLAKLNSCAAVDADSLKCKPEASKK